MSMGKPRPLAGGSLSTGSMKDKIIVILVLIVLILGICVIVLYEDTKARGEQLKLKQSDYDSLKDQYDVLSSSYTSLMANYTTLDQQYKELDSSYSNLSGEYSDLQNKVSLDDSRLKGFLEDDASISYAYTVNPTTLMGGAPGRAVTVTVYNNGKKVADRVIVICTVKEDGVTNSYNKVFEHLQSMSKVRAEWTFENSTDVINVWAGLD